jgi:hypothetical protein
MRVFHTTCLILYQGVQRIILNEAQCSVLKLLDYDLLGFDAGEYET